MGTRGSRGRTALVVVVGGGAVAGARAVGCGAYMQGAAAPAARLHLRRPPQPDGGWPRRYVAPDGAEIVDLRTADCQLGKPAEADAPCGGLVHCPRGATMPQLGTITAEAHTRVSVEQRLVDFSSFGIIAVELSRRHERAGWQPRWRRSRPACRFASASSRSIACSRTVDASSIRAEERQRREGGSAGRVLQHATGRGRQHRRRSDVEPDPGQRSALRGQHQLGSVRASAVARRSSCGTRTTWLKAANVEGPWAAAGTLPPSFTKLPADENWKEVRAALPGRDGRGIGVADGVRQHDAGGADPPPRGSRSTSRCAARACCGSATPRPTCSGSDRAGPVYFLVAGRWFSAPGFSPARGRLPRPRCRRTSRRSRSNTSARACWRRCLAPCRRPRRCCWRRCRRPRASTRKP